LRKTLETEARSIILDADGQTLTYVYFEDASA
jgi:hypothetical protein